MLTDLFLRLSNYCQPGFNEHNAYYEETIFSFYWSLSLFYPVQTKYFVFVWKAPFCASLQRLKTRCQFDNANQSDGVQTVKWSLLEKFTSFTLHAYSRIMIVVFYSVFVLFVFIAYLRFLARALVWTRKSLRNEMLTRICPIVQIASFRKRVNRLEFIQYATCTKI